MNLNELKETHAIYQANAEQWSMFGAAYNGTKALIDWGALGRNERESVDNYNRRIKAAYGFDYSEAVVDILNFYLFQKPATNDYGSLADDPLFQLFKEDSDFIGTEFKHWLIRQSRNNSVFGTVGILVDKPQVTGTRTLNQDVEAKVYPYVSSYSPLNILDWKHERINGRPTLTYLKLIDDEENYRLWWQDKWEVWRIVKNSPVKQSEGINPLGIVPFFWMDNGDTGTRQVGKSDIREVSRIDISLLRNLSQGEEVLDYAAFPMMLKPMQSVGGPADDDLVGVTAVLEFDPRTPEAKPEWLTSQVNEPIDAILVWIEKKVAEIYRSQNITGIVTSGDAKSGEALRREFQMLNSRLSAKAEVLEAAEKKILTHWCQWQNKLDAMKTVTISMPREFDVTDLAQDLDNILIAKGMVTSKAFNLALQKSVVRRTLPNANHNQLNEIDTEIETGPIPVITENVSVSI